MAKDVTSRLRSVSVEQIKNRKYFTRVWSVPAKCDLNYVCFNWSNCPTLSIPFNERGKIIYPLDGLDITTRDGCELDELEKQAMKMLSKAATRKSKNLKLKISYEEPLGDIELELANDADEYPHIYDTLIEKDVFDTVQDILNGHSTKRQQFYKVRRTRRSLVQGKRQPTNY